MNIMMKAMPNRTFDVGICRGACRHLLRRYGERRTHPILQYLQSFAQRAYDNIIHDMALLNLPVIMCLDRAGLVGEDGPTHHGAFDMAGSPSDSCISPSHLR